jgi:hypothetical protein
VNRTAPCRDKGLVKPNGTNGVRALKLVGAIALLIVAAVVALAYFHLSPVLTFIIIGVALYLFARKGDGEDSLSPQSVVDWGSGHGIYLRRDDKFVSGIESDATADKDRREAERR